MVLKEYNSSKQEQPPNNRWQYFSFNGCCDLLKYRTDTIHKRFGAELQSYEKMSTGIYHFPYTIQYCLYPNKCVSLLECATGKRIISNQEASIVKEIASLTDKGSPHSY